MIAEGCHILMMEIFQNGLLKKGNKKLEKIYGEKKITRNVLLTIIDCVFL